MELISLLKKEETPKFSPFVQREKVMWGHMEKMAAYKPGREFHQEPNVPAPWSWIS